jgi:hypothetical protein
MPDDRKLDTRVKIHLGGLLVKSGIHHLDPALLYGALLSVKRVLEDPAKRDKLSAAWTQAGVEAGVPSHPEGVRDMLTPPEA